MNKKDPPIVLKAKEVLNNTRVPTLAQADELKRKKYFSYARQMYERLPISENFSKTKKLETIAICTYKDPDLPSALKYDKALKTLQEIGDINTSKRQETLGLTGAIYKRIWQYNGQSQNLDYSLYYYQKGYELWEEGKAPIDDAYTALNTAYMLDLLAHQEWMERKKMGIAIDISKQRSEANAIRHRIIEHFESLDAWPKDKPWLNVTLAEAHYGLQQFDKTKKYLQEVTFPPKSWEYETTARQLASIAQIHIDYAEVSDKPLLEQTAKTTLNVFLNDLEGVDSAFKGKVGLALSGGGFRASLYHIGVLAKLAELDVLQDVEALSCVSGGSIVGVYYYLKVKKLLESKEDTELCQADYIKIVAELEEEFLVKIQTNIRMKVFENLGANVDFFSKEDYSRTHRLGELYESVLYQDLLDAKAAREPIYMHDLEIVPKGETNFNIKTDNWRRRHKVPKLIINATTLNTGHNWQFTASFMGEPPGNIVTEVDAKYRLRRMYYYEAPEKYKQVRLGHAVAASSGVPGIFDPLPMLDLYPDVAVQLVDGGVHDNQGAAGLLEQECSILLVSDASGQLQAKEEKSSSILNVLTRTNDILMERVREGGFQDLKYRQNAGLIKELFFVHLTKELSLEDKNWKGATTPAVKQTSNPLTTYGIAKSLQQLLAGIRTDLDAFNDKEAYALMYSGYQMAANEQAQMTHRAFSNSTTKHYWQFLTISDLLKDTSERAAIIPLLETGGKKIFKVYLLDRKFRIAARIGLLLLVIALVYFLYTYRTILSNITIGLNVFTILATIGFSILVILANRYRDQLGNYIGWVKPESKIRKRILGVGLAAGLFITAKFYLRYLNKSYLRKGKVNKPFSQQEIQELLLPLLEKEGKRYQKNKNIFARPAQKGEWITTITSDGVETQNQVTNEDSYVVKNQTEAQESYIVEGSTFRKKYQALQIATSHFAEYQSIGQVMAIQLNKQRWTALGFPNTSAYLIASWGAPMIFKLNDYLVCPPDFSEVYRVAAKEFLETYVEV